MTARLTARERIREAALDHFGEQGYERATIRSIAHTARVSPGLLRHHYGSKDALRTACDEYVVEVLRDLNAQILSNPNGSARTRRISKRLGKYVARSLADGSASAGAIFDEMASMTGAWLERADQTRLDPPSVERGIRSALVTAMAMGIPLLHDHVSRALGTDMFEPEGDRLVALALIDIYSHPLLDSQAASAAKDGFGN